MKGFFTLLFALIVGASSLFVFSPQSSATNDKFKRSQRPIENRYIVVFEDDSERTRRGDTWSRASQLAAEFPGRVDRVFESAIEGYSVEMTEHEAQRLSQDARVKYVEEDGIIEGFQAQSPVSWGLDRIDQRLLAYDSTYNYSRTGTGVNVYVIDSGILTTHYDFQGRAVESFNAIHDNTPLERCNAHGTNVAGIIGGATFGVAKNVTLHSVRVIGCNGYSTVSDLISGVDWVTRNAVKPAVANMSLGTTTTRSIDDAVAAAIRSGVTVVAAAGNSDQDACRYSPAGLNEVITVGASTRFDERLYTSNYGACVDVFAPGISVETTGVQVEYPAVFVSGTSFASPYVAGVAALFLEANPLASPADVSNFITGTATVDVLSNIGHLSPNRLIFSGAFTSSPPTRGGNDGGDIVDLPSCAGTAYAGSLANSGDAQYQSSISGFSGGNGSYNGTLIIPAGTQFKLALEKKQAKRWSTVATAQVSDTNSTVSYRGRSGSYRWRIQAEIGIGSYTLCSVKP